MSICPNYAAREAGYRAQVLDDSIMAQARRLAEANIAVMAELIGGEAEWSDLVMRGAERRRCTPEQYAIWKIMEELSDLIERPRAEDARDAERERFVREREDCE